MTESRPLLNSSIQSYQTNSSSTHKHSSAGHHHHEDEEPIHENLIDRCMPYVHGKPITYKLWNNVAAGMTVSLINMPLSISLAVAADSTPVMGVITAIWAGFISALTGGSQYNIMGPTGALSGILARYAALFGVSCLPILSITSGIVMFLVFLFNWDKYVTYLPSSVSHGFTLGVAFIIAGGQLVPMLGLGALPPHEHYFQNLYETLMHVNEMDIHAFMIFLACWVPLFILVKKNPRVPWSVGVAAAGILIGYLSMNGTIWRIKTLKDKYGELSASLWAPPVENTAMEADLGDVIVASLSIAFVGVLESLISGKIADGLTRTTMNQRQECLAVALANIGAGMAGGLPATAALARTALNIRSGATSRLAGIINAFSSLTIAFLLLPLFGYLPLPVVAALLFQVAVGMIESKHLVKAYRMDKGALWLTLIVALLCLLLDPTAAIVIGAIAGLLRFAQNVATGYSEVTVTQDLTSGTKLDVNRFDSEQPPPTIFGGAWSKFIGLFSAQSETERAVQLRQHLAHTKKDHLSEHSVIYRIIGDLTYISAITHQQRLHRFHPSKHVILSLRYCYYIDMDGMEALEEAILELREHRVCVLSGISPMLLPLFLKCSWFLEMKKAGLIFENVQEATRYLQNLPASTNSAANQNDQSANATGADRGRALSFDGNMV